MASPSALLQSQAVGLPLRITSADASGTFIGDPRKEDLWAAARASLRPKDQAYIPTSSSTSVEDVLESLVKKKEECIRKQWRIPGSKPSKSLRDVFVSITRWVEKFVQVGDQVVQYDPGHAALPWAALRFVLQATVNDVQTYATFLLGIEKISNLMVRCAFYENIYEKRKHGSMSSELRRSIVELYESMLSFLAKAQRRQEKHTLKRAVGGAIQLATKIEQRLEEMDNRCKAVDSCIALFSAWDQFIVREELDRVSRMDSCRHTEFLTALKELQTPVQAMQEHVAGLHDGLKEMERKKILNWISAQTHTEHHSNARTGILSGTGEWFLTHPTLAEWMEPGVSSTLWLHGIPGCGKTKLVSILIDRLLFNPAVSTTNAPTYFYCSQTASVIERSDPRIILCSLARQMASRSPTSAILLPALQLYQTKTAGDDTAGPLKLDEAVHLIEELSAFQGSEMVIVLDAFDECDRKGRPFLIEAFQKIMRNSKVPVKLFISSRNDQDIVRHLSGFENLEIDTSNNQTDIESFVYSEVESRIRRNQFLAPEIPADLKNMIIERLCNEAQGMFLWVDLQLQYLCTLTTLTSIKRRLGTLPPDLRTIFNELYSTRMQILPEEEQEIVHAIFACLLHVRRPLKDVHFQSFLQFTVSNGDELLSISQILQLTFNFVAHTGHRNPTDPQFTFIHLSVQEYLISNGQYSGIECNSIITKGCLRQLLSIGDEREQDNDDYDYACEYWSTHCAELGPRRRDPMLQSLLYKFFLPSNNRHFRAWSRKSEFWVLCQRDIPMTVASRFGIDEVVEGLLDANPASLYLDEEVSRAPLLQACRYGHLPVVQNILLWLPEEDLDEYLYQEVTNKRSTLSQLVLATAVTYGYEDLVDFLIEANFDRTYLYEDFISCYKLNKLAQRGNESNLVSKKPFEIVLKLLSEDAYLDRDSKVRNRERILRTVPATLREGLEQSLRLHARVEIPIRPMC